MDIYFIRHGDPDYTTDTLTAKGHEQAEMLAEAIKDWQVDEVYQSTMGRAQQTASYSLAKWNKPVTTLEWIQELCWGENQGDAYASDSPWVLNDKFIQVEHKYPVGDEWKNRPEIKNDRIVTDLENRYKAFDEFLAQNGYVRDGQLYRAEQPNNKKLVFFCHGGLLSALISYAMNISFGQMIAHTGVKVTSISKLHFSEEKGYCAAQLVYFNNFNHLNLV